MSFRDYYAGWYALVEYPGQDNEQAVAFFESHEAAMIALETNPDCDVMRVLSNGDLTTEL